MIFGESNKSYERLRFFCHARFPGEVRMTPMFVYRINCVFTSVDPPK